MSLCLVVSLFFKFLKKDDVRYVFQNPENETRLPSPLFEKDEKLLTTVIGHEWCTANCGKGPNQSIRPYQLIIFFLKKRKCFNFYMKERKKRNCLPAERSN